VRAAAKGAVVTVAERVGVWARRGRRQGEGSGGLGGGDGGGGEALVRVVGMEEAVKAAEGKAVARVVAAREEGTAVTARAQGGGDGGGGFDGGRVAAAAAAAAVRVVGMAAAVRAGRGRRGGLGVAERVEVVTAVVRVAAETAVLER